MDEGKGRLPAVVPAPAGGITFVARPHPFSTDRVVVQMPAGRTLAEMLAIAGVDLPAGLQAHVLIDGQLIYREYWHRVRPKPGSSIAVRVVPAGGGRGAKVWRWVLMIAVVVAAYALPPLILGTELAGATLIGGLTYGAALGAVIGVAGSLLVNALIPPPMAKADAADAPTHSLSGGSNRPRPYQAVPYIVGRHIVFPDLIDEYTEIAGDNQYLRQVFVVGHGPLQMTDWRIGNTPIGEFDDVSLEVRQGYPNDPAFKAFPRAVVQEPLQILLRNADGWIARTTPIDVDEISLDFVWDRGLVRFNDEGKKRSVTVELEAQYAPAGTGAWQPLGAISITAAQTSALRRALRLVVARGTYDVRCRRITGDSDSDQILDTVYWTALRTFQNEDPIGDTDGIHLAKVALRIRANEQLSGRVDRLSCIAHAIRPEWDPAAQAWIERPTSQPAAFFRDVLVGPGNARRLPDSRVDLAALARWAENTKARGLEVNGVWADRQSVMTRLRAIAAAGRASLGRPDGRYSVVEDLPQAEPVQIFTPRNSWGFRGTRIFRDEIHGFRVRFENRALGWETDEKTVYVDGYNERTATLFEVLKVDDLIDNWPQAWKAARYHLADAILRPEVWELSTDIEHIVCTKGDWVRVAHDSILVGQGSARVKAVAVDDVGDAVSITVDEAMTMEAGKAYAWCNRSGRGVVRTFMVETAPGTTHTLVLSSPVAAEDAPRVGELGAFGEAGIEMLDALVREIVPGRSESAKLVLVPLAPEIHDADKGEIPPYNPGISLPPGSLTPFFERVRSDESVLLRDIDGSFRARILIDLGTTGVGSSAIETIELRFRQLEAETWSAVQVDRYSREISLLEVEEGVEYELQARYRYAGREPGPWSSVVRHLVVGKSTPPADVTGFMIDGDRLFWQGNSDRDLAGYRIRYQHGVNDSFGDAVPMHEGLISEAPYDLPARPAGVVTIMIKAVDVAGNESRRPAVIVVDLGDAIVANVIEDYVLRDGAWPGPITNGSVDGSGDIVANETSLMWKPHPAANLYSFDSLPFYSGSVYSEMVYEASILVTKALAGSALTLRLDIEGEGYRIDFRRPGQKRMWAIYDTEAMWAVDDAVALWTVPPYQPWPGEIVPANDVYDFRVTIGAGRTRGRIRELTPTVDVPDIVETIGDLVIDLGGTRLPITKGYYAIKVVNLTIQADSGDARTIKIIDKDPQLGPLVRAFDADGLPSTATVDATVQGY